MNVDSGFEKVKQKIFELGLDLSRYTEGYIKRRLNVRMMATSIKNYDEYLKVLESSNDEFLKFIDTFTINVTEFFRDPSVWNFLRKEIFPTFFLEKQRGNQKTVRIWSCGCASGEEPYSLSILLNEYFESKIQEFLINIIGTDIDTKSLEKAIKGVYSKNVLKNVEYRLLKKYFIQLSENNYKISDKVKNIVKFQWHDFIKNTPLFMVDVILCRNVFIYLTPETRDELLIKFYSSLNPGGYLVIGKSETILFSKNKTYFTPVNLSERIFKKI